MSTSGHPEAIDARPRSRPGRLADPLRAARLLAQPRARRVHVRVPGDAAGDLREPRQGSGRLSSLGGIPYDDFFVPGILAYGVIATTFVNLSIGTAILRDEGVLKRMQGTPLPTLGVCRGADRLDVADHARDDDDRARSRVGVYGLDFHASQLPALIVTLLLGTAAFTSLGIGITRFIPNAEAGPVVVNLVIWPLSFISNVWFPTNSLPSALKTIAELFPIRALASGLQYVFDPLHHGSLFDGVEPEDARDLDGDRDLPDGPVPAPAAGRGRVTTAGATSPSASAGSSTAAARADAAGGAFAAADLARVHPVSARRRDRDRAARLSATALTIAAAAVVFVAAYVALVMLVAPIDRWHDRQLGAGGVLMLALAIALTLGVGLELGFPVHLLRGGARRCCSPVEIAWLGVIACAALASGCSRDRGRRPEARS